MAGNSNAPEGRDSWLKRLWTAFVEFGAAMEMTEAELLSYRVAALEAAERDRQKAG